jgi:holo-[acyl-carrier protein] synthase
MAPEAVGVGVDMVEVARIERAMTRTPSFEARMFTEEERVYARKGARPYERFASRFAAREAALKSLGIGFNDIDLHDISVTVDLAGRPHIKLEGYALEVAREQGVLEIAVSLSHTKDLAVASAVAVTEAARPKQDEAVDQKEVMQRSFKEARSVIDDLERVLDS